MLAAMNGYPILASLAVRPRTQLSEASQEASIRRKQPKETETAMEGAQKSGMQFFAGVGEKNPWYEPAGRRSEFLTEW
ncbi:MAG: hypothetical protein WB543_04705 [Candidatus Acidiferrum sp.]